MCPVIGVGFEITEVEVEETVNSSVVATVTVLQGQIDSEFVIGVQAVNKTATST